MIAIIVIFLDHPGRVAEQQESSFIQTKIHI